MGGRLLSQKAEDKRPDTQRPRRRIQSIGVGFRLIKALESSRQPLSLSMLAQRADMSTSQAHLYLVSFCEVGLTEQHSTTHCYSLGPYAISLGLAAIRQLDVVEAARQHMATLQTKLEAPLFLSVWGNNGPTIVLKLDWDLHLPMMIRIGYSLPITMSATGRLFLAHLPRSEASAFLTRPDRPLSSDDMEIPDDAALEHIRRDGVAWSDSRLNSGFAALSAPIFDHDQSIAAALTLLAPNSYAGFRNRQATSEILIDAVRDISRSIGATF